MGFEDKQPKSNLSVRKALSIINLLAENEGHMSLTEISSALGLTMSTTHHIITSLKIDRFVDQSQDTKKYRIGLRLYEIGLSKNYYNMLASKTAPVLESLSTNTGESSNLAVLIDGQITYIAQKQSSNMMKTFVQLGKRSPVHCTGVGKVLVSELSREEIEDIVNKHGIKKYTPQTITNLENLLDELSEVSKNGYAIDREEREEGVVCIAVPVYSSSHRIIAAISISGPTTRIKSKNLTGIIKLLKNHAGLISAAV